MAFPGVSCFRSRILTLRSIACLSILPGTILPGSKCPIILFATICSVPYIYYIGYWAYSLNSKAESLLEREQALSEALLLNILPSSIAASLKDNPGRAAERYESASVLFADVVGFTASTEHMDSTDLIRFLDTIFVAFDAITEKRGAEKIKTIGDAYMVATGIPERIPDHCRRILRIALEMVEAISGLSNIPVPDLQIRVGVHTGPFVAGVIGRKKFSYDIWGDSVNMASRLESSGVPGRIQVSQAVIDAASDEFAVERRGIVDLKGKGKTETFFLLGVREPAV